jgi:hypothetical protein
MGTSSEGYLEDSEPEGSAAVSPSHPLEGRYVSVDEVVTGWPDVRGKNVFGHRGWVRSGRMIGFVAGSGVAVKALTDAHSVRLYDRPRVMPFVYNGAMEMRGWPVLPLESDADMAEVLSELKRVYDAD